MQPRFTLRRPGIRPGLYALLLLAFALRVYHLDASSLWWDESLSYVRATSDLGTILANQIPIQNLVTRDLHPPLYFLLLHLGVGAWGVSEFALRFLGAFANVATLPLFYLVARRWFRLRVSWLAAALAAISPFYVYYSQEARPYALVLFWSLLVAYAIGRLVSRGNRPSAAARPPLAARGADFPVAPVLLYLLASGAMLATHYLSFLLLPFHALWLYLGGRGRVRYLAALPLAGFLVAFPLIPLVSPSLSTEAGPQFVPWLTLFRDLLNSYTIGVTASIDQLGWLDLAMLLVVALGLYAAWRTSRGTSQTAVLLLAYLLLPPVLLELGSYIRPMYMNSRHLLAASAPFYLAGAAGVDWLLRRRWAAPLGLAALALCGYGATVALGNLYFNPDYAKDDHRAWVEYLQERVRPGDGLVLVSPQAETVYRYYAGDLLPWISLPNLGLDLKAQERADFVAVRDAFQKWSRIWLLELHAPVADSEGHIAELIRRWGTRLDRVYFHGQSTEIILSDFISGSPFTAEAPPVAHPRSAHVTDELVFLGYDAPAQVGAGERGMVKLLWRVDAPTGESFGTTVFVKDEAEEVWGQADEMLLGNLRQAPNWTPGQVATDNHNLNVDPAAPPGRYALWLQVYRFATGAPVGAQIPLGEVEVTRPASPVDAQRLVLTRRMQVDFGGVALLGYNLDSDVARPGETLPLLLYFRLGDPRPVGLTGRVAFAPAWLPVWTIGSIPFSLDTRGRLAGDIVRVQVPVRLPPDLAAGSYLLKLMPDRQGPDLWSAWTGVGLGTARVLPVTRTTVMPAGVRPLDARFGEGIELAGYDEAHTGDRLTIALYWRSRAPVATSLKVFVHLLDGSSRILAQQDGFPQDGARPTTTWAPGEVIADFYELELPPDLPRGEYPIEVGLYNPVDNVRPPAFLDDRAVADGRILLDPYRIP